MTLAEELVAGWALLLFEVECAGMGFLAALTFLAQPTAPGGRLRRFLQIASVALGVPAMLLIVMLATGSRQFPESLGWASGLGVWRAILLPPFWLVTALLAVLAALELNERHCRALAYAVALSSILALMLRIVVEVVLLLYFPDLGHLLIHAGRPITLYLSGVGVGVLSTWFGDHQGAENSHSAR